MELPDLSRRCLSSWKDLLSGFSTQKTKHLFKKWPKNWQEDHRDDE
jgi:hypothetical protein